MPLCIVVLGASGDLASKKTFPALFHLFCDGFIPAQTKIVGYARSHLDQPEFYRKVAMYIKPADHPELHDFLSLCSYVSGKYNDPESFKLLNSCIETLFDQNLVNQEPIYRIFYMALPPSVFIPAASGLRQFCCGKNGYNRLVVEKPFGKDSDTSKELAVALARDWDESEIYRIDHYLGKEMVKNLMTLRFANVFFWAVWNRQYIHNVQIVFKETIGTQGRGGYFDEFGIIRDIMQNHLLQILTIVAMAKPVSLDAEDVRNEKVKVLKAIRPLTLDDVVLGQYTASADGTNPGYKEDKGVPADSVTPTYAAAVFYIRNERWDNVPFVLRCGKALNEQKAEIRIQFQDVPGNIYGNLSRNELVIRVQPNEAVYMKFINKKPGLSAEPVVSELDLSYKSRYSGMKIPDAYESLLLDVLKGDKSNFVRDDELEAAWSIFTPLLHQIENERIQPEFYEYGSRGPTSLEPFIKKHGYRRSFGYEWKNNL